jgi:hypothetical protein
MINLTHIISILNFIFIIVFYRDEQNDILLA